MAGTLSCFSGQLTSALDLLGIMIAAHGPFTFYFHCFNNFCSVVRGIISLYSQIAGNIVLFFSSVDIFLNA